MSFDAETRDHRRVQRWHAIKMCKERYGIALDHEMYSLICDRVWAAIHGTGDRDVVAVGKHQKARYFVTFRGVVMLVAWSDVTLQVATFLPRWSELSEREDGLKRAEKWDAQSGRSASRELTPRA